MSKATKIEVGYSVRMSYDYQAVEGEVRVTLELDDEEAIGEQTKLWQDLLKAHVRKDVLAELREVAREAQALKNSKGRPHKVRRKEMTRK